MHSFVGSWTQMNGTLRIVCYEVLWMKNVAAFVRKFFYEFRGLSVTKCWMKNVAAFVRIFFIDFK